MANIKGSLRNDVLNGTAGADRIQGLGGNDRLYGHGGNDSLEGGGGDDLLQGGAGSDTIDGGIGSDTLDYSNWSHGIRLRPTNDTQNESGKGLVEEWDAARNVLSTDTFVGIENVIGSAGADYIWMDWTANAIRGGDGDDHLIGGPGDDHIYGEAGDDELDAGDGSDFLDGGAGTDTVFWWTSRYYWTPSVDLATGRITYAGHDLVDTVVNIENVRGDMGHNFIGGDGVANVLMGIGGDDVIEGRGGNDLLIGDQATRPTSSSQIGQDRISGGDGNDVIVGDAGDDLLSGGSGADRFEFDVGSGHDRITDFQSGMDSIALFGGLAISAWELRDSDGDGVGDSQMALLSDGSTIMFVGCADQPDIMLTSSMEALHYPMLGVWG